MDAPGTLHGALIGCGAVAQYHLQAWPRVPGTRLAALCDVRPDRLEWAGAMHPEARRFTDAAAMFERERFDFVEICTRPEAHRELVELAARHGAHVLCQKPVAAVRTDLLAMIAACDGAGVRFMVHENWRFRPWYRAMRARVEAGTVGRPIRVRISHLDTRALRPGGFGDQPYLAERPRLILLEMGCHLIDTARSLMGEVREVMAITGRFGDGHPGEDVASLSLRFASGALGLLDLSWCAPPDLARPEWAINETVVEGTEAALRLRLDGALERVDRAGRAEFVPVELPPPDRVYLEGYRATQAHFIRGLSDGTPHETSGSDTLRTMDVVWAAYRSAEEGRTVSL